MSSFDPKFLAKGLHLRPANYFGLGSVEVSSPPPEKTESSVRRLAITSGALVEHPHSSVHTIPDVLDYAVHTYGSAHNAVGWRDVVKVHEEAREISKTVEGEERIEKKSWKLYELTDYKFLTFVEFAEVVSEVSKGLIALGIRKEDVVNVYSQTSVNWRIVSHACASISTAIATAYDTLGVDGLSHSLNEPECSAIFTNFDLLPTLAQVIDHTPALKYVFFDGSPAHDILDSMRKIRPDIHIIHLDELRALARNQSHEEIQMKLEQRRPTPNTLACIMYTSGSTGAPKGVCITHANLIASVSSVAIVFGPHVPCGDIYLAYLPLAHVLEYIVELCALFVGVTCGYARPKTLTDAGVNGCEGDLKALKPNIMFGVPGVWETIRKGIVGKLQSGGVVKRSLFYAAMEARKKDIPFFSGLAERVVLSKVREVTGGRLKFAMNGGAPISKETQEFLSLSITPMLQGYGMTESCGMCTLLPPEYMQFGAVGLPVPSIEIKLSDIPEAGYLSSNERAQGEIWIRGPSVSKGYYKRPDLNEDCEIWTTDGWFRTGDVGVWNDDGTLSLIDRVKNLVKMQNGEFIGLEHLESIYKSCDYVSNICVYATSGATYPIAIVFPHEANLRHAISVSLDSQLVPLQSADLPMLCADRRIQRLVLQSCNEVGKKNRVNRAELLGGVVLGSEEWTPESGLVSAAMKVKRTSIATAFSREIKTVYEPMS